MTDLNLSTDELDDDPLEALRQTQSSFEAGLSTTIPAFAQPIEVVDLDRATESVADVLARMVQKGEATLDANGVVIEPDDDPNIRDSDTPAGAEPIETPVIDDLDEATLAEYTAATSRTIPRAETWEDIIGNERAIGYCRESIASAKGRNNPVDHILIYGPAGMGKTTLSKIIARDMGSFYIETTASTLTTHENVMRVLHQMNVGRAEAKMPAVWFIDEIHVLGKKGLPQEAFFPLLEDWVFDHNREGKKVSFRKDGAVWRTSKFLTWPFTAIGATTDPGILSAPLTRRFNLQIELEPYTNANIAEIVRRGAARLGIMVTETAGETLANYSRRNPGRAFNILAYARTRMDALGAPEVNDEILAETIERMNIFPLGLTRSDIRALELLAGRYPRGIGQLELSKAIGIQVSQFSQMIEPFIRQLGFVQTLNRRVITGDGIRYLASIDRAPMENPAVRALVRS